MRVGFFKKYLYEGEKIRKLIHQNKQWSSRVPHYLVSHIKNLLTKQKHIPYRFQHIALGGTFDHFHEGHRKLINTALKYGKNISIGITTKKLLKNKKFSELIEPFKNRKISVMHFLKEKKTLKRATFFPLIDIYGPTAYDGTIEAVVVSKSTYPNAIKINKLREKKSLPELTIICIKDVKDKYGKLISSESIRDLILPEYLRKELRKPLGTVIRGKENELKKTADKIIQLIKRSKPLMLITVGDIIVNSLEKAGLIPDVKIIDYRSRRLAIKKPSSVKKAIINRPGTISKEAVEAIKSSIVAATKSKQTIIIEGEEDLLALPAIISAPLGSMVLYGQVDLGVVIVVVNKKKKEKIADIIKKFQ